MRAFRFATALMGIGGLLAALPLHAEKADERMREQLRNTVVQMRALADENASLKAQLAQAQAQVNAKPAEDPAKVTRLQGNVGKLKSDVARLEVQLQDNKVAMQACNEVQKADTDAAARFKLDTLQKLLGEQRNAERNGQALAQCTADNRTLVSIADEVIARYRDRGVVDAALASEPVTGLRRAQLERMAQTYEIRVGDHTLRDSAPPPDVGGNAANNIDTGQGK